MNAVILAAGHAEISHLVELAPGASALVIGTREVAEAVARSGVTSVRWVEAMPGMPLESHLGAAASALGGLPEVVLTSTADADRALAGALAGRHGVPVFTLPIEVAAGRLVHRVASGIGLRTIDIDGPLIVVAEGGEQVDTGSSAPIELVAGVAGVAGPATGGLRVVEERLSGETPVDLKRARRIVAVGRGLPSRAALDGVTELAGLLGAEVAGSRPVTEGAGWLASGRCVGLSGVSVAPELYVALGISGQLQHTVGARSSGTIVVVNSDPSAPYFGECDLGVVGDLGQLVEALRRRLS